MPLINQLKVHGEQVAPLLQDGERLLDVGLFHPAFGDESGLERPTELTSRPEQWLRDRFGDQAQPQSQGWVNGVDPVWGLEWNAAALDKALGGVAAAGSASSIAARMLVLQRKSSDIMYYAVTDRRLLLLAKPTIHTFEPVLAVPRAAIRGARLQGKLFFPQRGRVVLWFADGSQLAIVTGTFSTARAKSLVAALGS
jgi:hypothetical protein